MTKRKKGKGEQSSSSDEERMAILREMMDIMKQQQNLTKQELCRLRGKKKEECDGLPLVHIVLYGAITIVTAVVRLLPVPQANPEDTFRSSTRDGMCREMTKTLNMSKLWKSGSRLQLMSTVEVKMMREKRLCASTKGDEDIMAEGGSTDPSSQHDSLFIFKEDNALRRKCKAIVTWTPFEYAILIIIIINCVILGFGLYLPDDSETGQLLEKTEIYFLIVFLVEMVLKVIAYGFVLHPGSYLRNPWNIIDFFVIIVGIVSFFPLGIELSVLRMLRIVRLLRLFRLIKLLRSKN